MRLASNIRFAAALLCLTAPVSLADTTHLIALKHRPASEIEPVLRPLLRPEEALSATGYQLVLRASEPRRAEIERIVASLDVALRQLTITLRQNTVRHEARRRESISGSIDLGSGGEVTIGEGAGDRRRDGLRVRAERRDLDSDQTRTQTLRVQDGQRGFIRIGQSAPAVERIVVLTGHAPTLAARGWRYRDFTTGFDVLPRVRGDTVQLDITPRLSGPREADGLFKFQELQTTVALRLGQWIDLGAAVGETSDVHRAIFSGGSSQTSERTSITLKVE